MNFLEGQIRRVNFSDLKGISILYVQVLFPS